MTIRSGSCLCGKVKVAVRGTPSRIGICHCMDCRQESGSAFTFFAVWPAAQFESLGKTSEFSGRRFCPQCGSRIFSANGAEVEIKLGVFLDAPTDLKPTYELWIKRREPWLSPIADADQFDQDRL